MVMNPITRGLTVAALCVGIVAGAAAPVMAAGTSATATTPTSIDWPPRAATQSGAAPAAIDWPTRAS